MTVQLLLIVGCNMHCVQVGNSQQTFLHPVRLYLVNQGSWNGECLSSIRLEPRDVSFVSVVAQTLRFPCLLSHNL